MHCKGILGAYSYDNITENKRTSVGVDLNGNYLLILETELFGILGSCMNVTLCNDNALAELDLTCGSYQLTCAAACDIARLTAGCVYADRTGVRSGKLNLSLGTYGTENRYSGKAALGSDNLNSFV